MKDVLKVYGMMAVFWLCLLTLGCEPTTFETPDEEAVVCICEDGHDAVCLVCNPEETKED